MSKRISVSLEKKLSIIKKVEEGCYKKKDIAKEFGVPFSTLSTIIANKDYILQSIENNELCAKRKRLRTCVFKDIEQAMLKWLIDARKRNHAISGKLIKQKAKEFADAFGRTEFKMSTGWLHKFKQRHGIIQKIFYGGECTDGDECKMNFNENIDGQDKDNPQSDAEDIVSSFLYIDDEELTGEEKLVNAKELLPTLEQVTSSMKVIRSFLVMKSDVPTEVFGALKILEDIIQEDL